MESDYLWGTFKYDPGEVHVAPLWNGRPPRKDLTVHDFHDPCWCDYKIEVGKDYFIVIHEKKQRNTFLTL